MSFDLEKEIEKFEKANNVSEFEKDTSLAIMMIQKNKVFIKSKIHNDDMHKKHRNAIKLLLKSYPLANKKVISKQLFRIGIFSNKLIVLIISLIAIMIDVGIITILCKLITEDMFGLLLLSLGIIIGTFFIYSAIIEDLWDNLND